MTYTEIAIAVVEHDGSCLIGQRPAGTNLAGLWEFPGGKVEPSETAAEAAVRECREEAGIAIVVDHEHSIAEHVYAHGAVRLHFFICRPVDPAAAPSAPYRWVPRSELRRYEFPAANAAIVRELVDCS